MLIFYGLSRSKTSISYSGFITRYAAGGASATFLEYSFININGEMINWYEYSESCTYGSYDYDNMGNKIVFPDLDLSDIYKNNYCFKEGEEYRSFLNILFVWEKNDLIAPKYDVSIDDFRRIYNDAGITTYTMEEIDEIIDKRREEIGLDEAVVMW